MIRLIFALGLALSLIGCGEDFSNGGTAGSAGDGGTAGSAGDGGTAGSAGDGGNAGSAGEGGQGGENPCQNATYEDIANLIGKPCVNLFASGCDTDNPVRRDEFIGVIPNQVPMLGYTPLTVKSFDDVLTGHPAFSDVDKVVWLKKVIEYDDPDDPLDDEVPFFHPADPTTTCFAQEVVTKMQALPAIYALPSWQAGNTPIPSNDSASLTTRFTVYGASPSSPLSVTLNVVNNSVADFTVTNAQPPVPTDLLQEVILACQVPVGAGFTYYSTVNFSTGIASFTVNCYRQDGSPLELQLQIDPTLGKSGSVRIGIEESALVIRRGPVGTQASNPIRNITP